MNNEHQKRASTSAKVETQQGSSSDVNPLINYSTSQDESSKFPDFNPKDKARHFWYIVYPDSAPEDWIEQLQQTGIPFCVSPLHDSDENPDRTPKKPHWHVIVSWSNTTTYSAAMKIAEMLHSPRPQKLTSVIGAYRYHQHKDNPEKYQYKEISKCYNGWQVPLDSLRVNEIKRWMRTAVITQDCEEYQELLQVCEDEGPEYEEVAMNNTFYAEKLCASYRHGKLRVMMRFYNSLPEGELKKQIKNRIDNYQGGNNYES